MCNLINICMLWHCALECPTWSTCYHQVFASVLRIGMSTTQHLYTSTLWIGMCNLINICMLRHCTLECATWSTFVCFNTAHWNVNYSMFLVLLCCELECAANQTFLELFAHQVFFHSSFLVLFPFLGSSWNDTSMFLWWCLFFSLFLL